MSLQTLSFPEKNRLRKSSEFLETFRKGRSVRELGVALHFKKNTLEETRFGIAVSRKSMPRAVDRNRAKRVVREFFRIKQSDSVPKYDIIVRLIGPFKSLKNKELRNTLESLFSKVRLIT